MLVFFFFQAEDGIRVSHVTGVQTCALPILLYRFEIENTRYIIWVQVNNHCWTSGSLSRTTSPDDRRNHSRAGDVIPDMSPAVNTLRASIGALLKILLSRRFP